MPVTQTPQPEQPEVLPTAGGAPVGRQAHQPSALGGSTARLGDRVFRAMSTGSGILVLAIIVAIAVFLLTKGISAVGHDSTSFLSTKTWDPDDDPSTFGIAALAFGTVVSSVIAVILAVPVAVGVALFTTHYAPRRLAAFLGYLIDLLAAVPSVVFGLWGLIFLVPRMIPLSRYLSTHLGWFPLFASNGTYGKSIFAASVVLAVMVLPIVAAISREVFRQTPVSTQEGALALGATRWEMIRTAVLPYGRPGVISGVMLGLGRALGETIAVALVLSSNYEISKNILQPGGNTVAANIATVFGDAGPIGRGALIASGLVLFALTLVVNLVARAVVARRREFAGSAA